MSKCICPERFTGFPESLPDCPVHNQHVEQPNINLVAFKRTHVMLGLIVGVLLLIAVLFTGRAMGTTKTIIVTKLPESLVCQPFRTKEDHAEQIKRIKQSGAQEIMFQMLGAAYEAQSRGEGQVISFSNYACAEKLGHMQSARASTYYFVSSKK